MTLIDKAEALLPCPFCGGGVSVTTTERVGGIVCDAPSECIGSGLLIVFDLEDMETALAAWNRRAAIAPTDAAHVNEKPKSEHDAGNVLTDAALIARLREIQGQAGLFASAAADRIEQLVKSRDAYAEMERIATEALRKSEARVERLEAALVEHNDLLRSALAIAKREGVEGQIASTNWDAYYNRVAVVLKRHHQTANEARASLKGTDHE